MRFPSNVGQKLTFFLICGVLNFAYISVVSPSSPQPPNLNLIVVEMFYSNKEFFLIKILFSLLSVA